MEPEIRARFTADVRAAVAASVGVPADALSDNLGFESFVHKAERPGGAIYVKSTWSERRTQAQTQAELSFVRHLADGGASVTRPVPLADGSDVAPVPADGGAFLVSAHKEAPGARLAVGAVTDAHLFAWGELVGRMHKLAADPICERWTAERPAWTEEYEPLLRYASDSRVAERYEAQLAALKELPTGPDVFGLIHTDLHDANVHFDGLTPTAFDFEDCIGFWYASDLAIILYYALNRHIQKSQRQEAYERFARHLRAGYETVHTLPDSAWESFPLFLDIRDCVLWLVSERSVPRGERGPAFQEWIDGIFERIVGGEHAMSLHF